MVQRPFPVVQVKSLPTGTAEYEEKRKAVLEVFYDKIPSEYLLPQDLLEHPPTDVSTVPLKCGILSPREIEITESHDAVSLAEAIAAKKYTAVSVAIAFCKRAIIAHQLTCCLTQWFMKEAIEQAQQLDEHLAMYGKPVGPLHGVPVSIKDHMPIAGTYSSVGSFSSIAKNDKDCQMVQILRDLGAVFYVKTNQPQSLMHLESDSHWGRTLNPFNINLSAGGSTGGESALLAMRGSILGVGTDIGGSIRAPSAFCGIYGFKPTSYTLPMRDYVPEGAPAELNISVSTGPMCHTMRDMDLFMQHVLAAQPYLNDPALMPLPWSGLSTPTKKLKIGIMTDDGFIRPQPPVERAISWAQSILSNSKYTNLVEVKPFKPYKAMEAWTHIRKMYYPDGAKNCRSAIESSGEPVHSLTEWIFQDGEQQGELTATGVTKMRTERDAYRVAFAESWTLQDVDIVLCPAFVGPASMHDTAFYWTYTSLFNLVDYPGLVFPTPVKAEAGETYPQDYTPLSDACAHVKQLWDEGDFVGAPINLQLVGRRYHDNALFGALSVLKGILNLA